MSLTQIFSSSSANADDHFPIIRHLARHDTLHGGWNEWSAGCICGWLDSGVPGRWFIPSKQSAESLYNAHLRRATGQDMIDYMVDQEPDEEPEITDAELVAQAFHETYEAQAPHHGWETQQRSRKVWEEVPEENRRLMVSVAQTLLDKGVIHLGNARK